MITSYLKGIRIEYEHESNLVTLLAESPTTVELNELLDELTSFYPRKPRTSEETGSENSFQRSLCNPLVGSYRKSELE